MPNGTVLAVVALAFLLGLAFASHAAGFQDEAPSLARETRIRDTLTGNFDSWLVTDAMGELVTVEVTSDDFPPLLVLRSPTGDILGADLQGLFEPEPEPEDVPYIRQVLEALELDLNDVLDLALNPQGRFIDGARVVALLPTAASYTIDVAAARMTSSLNYDIVWRPMRRGFLGDGGSVQDSLRDDGPGIAVWEFNGQAGHVAWIGAGSDDFDAVVELRDSMGRRIARDDDGGLGNDSRIAVALHEDAVYQVWLFTYGPGLGNYELVVDSRDTTPLEVNGATSVTVNGELGTDASDFMVWSFDGGAAQVVSVNASSPSFDTVVELRSSTGEILAENDDGGNGTDSQLTAVLPEDGTYQIWLTAYDNRDGEYELEAAIEDARDPDAGVWVFHGQRDQVVRVSARSAVFASVVQLLSPAGEEVARADAARQGLDSELVALLPVDGRYLVRVWAANSEDSGPYDVSVNTLRPEDLETDAPDPTPGTLKESSGIAAWRFRGTAGEAVRVSAWSEDFDTVVELRSPNGERIARDDNGGPGSDSQLVGRLEVDGTYHVWVTALGGGSGDYEVAVHTLHRIEQERLAEGEPEQGVLDAGGNEVAVWTFEGKRDNVVSIAVRATEGSDDFGLDAELVSSENGRLAGSSGTALGSDAEVVAVLVDDGPHEIRVTARGSGTGFYQIMMVVLPVQELGPDGVGLGAVAQGVDNAARDR